MKQVRIGVFETNSSSTHSICISAVRNDPLQYPSHIIFKCGEFGWREARLDTPEEKASYLYSSMICLFDRDELESSKVKILDHLAKEDSCINQREEVCQKKRYSLTINTGSKP